MDNLRVGVFGRLACRIRGHEWEEHIDPVGTLTLCTRCGALRHTPASEGPPGFDYTGPAGGGSS